MSKVLKQASLVINERGEVMAATAANFAIFLGARQDREKILKYAVQQMGWVAIRHTQNDVHAIIERQHTSHLALLGLLDYVYRRDVKLTLAMDTRERRQIAFADRAVMVSQLSALIEERKPQPCFVRRTIPVHNSVFASRVSTAFEIVHGDMEETTRLRLLDAVLDSNYAVNELDQSCGHYRANSISEKITQFGKDSVENRIGRTYHDFISPKVGSWLADCFAEMATQTRTRTEFLITEFPVQGTAVRRQFQRLLLPFERGGKKFLLASSNL